MQTIWLTGLSQSGKSTLAQALKEEIFNSGHRVQVIDGDMVRSISQTGFDDLSIKAHLERVALMAKLLNREGVYVIVPVIAPSESIRQSCQQIISKERFSLVFVDTPKEICQQIDTKGLWRAAQVGEILNFAGVSKTYEPPNVNLDDVFHSKWPREQKDEAKDIWSWVQAKRSRPSALFVGRWQPLHLGHVNIIERAINEEKRVVVAIRQTPRNESNPLPIEVVEELLWATFGNKIEVMRLPDIESVNIGREVGYAVNEIEVDPTMRDISATKIRESLKAGSTFWRSQVPAETAEILTNSSKYFN